MINKFDALFRSWGFGQDDEIAMCRFLAARYPDIAQEGIARPEKRITLDQVVSVIASVYGYTAKEVAAKGRDKHETLIMRCRATILDLLNDPGLYNMGRPEIGRRFMGGRDNSTLIHTWRTRFSWDSEYEKAVKRVATLSGVDYHETLSRLKTKHGRGIATSADLGGGTGTPGLQVLPGMPEGHAGRDGVAD